MIIDRREMREKLSSVLTMLYPIRAYANDLDYVEIEEHHEVHISEDGE